MTALCVSAAFLGGLGASQLPSARADVGATPTFQEPAGPMEDLARLVQQRSREDQPPFDFIYLNDEDIALGRRYLVLQGNAIGEELSSAHYFVATGDHLMDIHTLTYRARTADGSLFFLKNFGELPIDEALRAVVPFDDGAPSTTIHFDPPMRIEAGDAILASMQRTDPPAAGIGLFSMHATVPPGAGGDTMAIE